MTKVGQFEIEKGIPLPDAWPGFVKALRQMEVGDSFFVQDPGLCTMSTIYSLAYREGIRVSIRQQNDGIRIWKVEMRQHMDTASVKAA